MVCEMRKEVRDVSMAFRTKGRVQLPFTDMVINEGGATGVRNLRCLVHTEVVVSSQCVSRTIQREPGLRWELKPGLSHQCVDGKQ